MKIKIIILASLLICFKINSGFSQNWLLGGNGPGGINATNNILGTNNNFPIRFETTDIERMRINANTGINAAYLGNAGLFAFSTANYPGYCR